MRCKYLYPCKEDRNSDDIVIVNVPVCEEIEVRVTFSVFQQPSKQEKILHVAVRIERDGQETQLKGKPQRSKWRLSLSLNFSQPLKKHMKKVHQILNKKRERWDMGIQNNFVKSALSSVFF